jgi:hypothetical protein
VGARDAPAWQHADPLFVALGRVHPLDKLGMSFHGALQPLDNIGFNAESLQRQRNHRQAKE